MTTITASSTRAKPVASTDATAVAGAPWGIAILRIAVGVVFVAHGWQKLTVHGFDGVAGMFEGLGIPLPYLSAVTVTLTEFLGGLALVAGLFTRLASIPLAITMLVALVQVKLSKGFFLPDGFEFVMVLLSATIALSLIGAGAGSLDALRLRRKTEKEEDRQ